MKSYIKIILLLTGLSLCLNPDLQAEKSSRSFPYVLVIGIDGLGAHGIGLSKTPHMNALMKSGSYSLAARTVVPSSSGPAWSSMNGLLANR